MSIVIQERDGNDQLQESLLRLQQSTHADLVLLGEVLPSPFLRIRTISCRLDQAWLPNFSYLLDTHPCEKVIGTQEFQQWADAPKEFQEAFLLTDNGMHAYAGYPISLDTNKQNGILVIMSRKGWPDPHTLRTDLAAISREFTAHQDTMLNTIERTRLMKAGSIREEFFREYVLDNPEGVYFMELMPPVPIDLPQEQLMQRFMYGGYVVECNRAIARMYGYADTATMLGARTFDLNGPEKALRAAAFFQRQNFHIRDYESQAVDAEGNVTWVSGSAIGNLHDGKLLSIWTKRSDITAQKRYETAIHHKAHHDALTGLPNRYWFQDRIVELVKDHSVRGKRLCVGLLDLNGFKDVNDTLGHLVGDLILQALAVRLLKGLKPHDAELARLGGDEFAILVPEVADYEHGEAMAKTLQTLLAEPFLVEDMQLTIGGSLGLVMFPDWSEIDDDLLRLADVAMYAAKNAGQPFRWYRPDIDKHSKRQLSLLASLGSSIENSEMFLVYQPKIDVLHGRVAGFEALIRWKHAVHGIIPPDDFIPFAETGEVIRPLTRWVLNTAIGQGAMWLRNGSALKIAVNISVRNLLDEQLETYILDCLSRHAFPAELLELEITESALMTHPAQAMSILHTLRSHGIAIAIDDFGTGYSSLAYLARLPVTTLKVDQAFVKDMVNSKTDEQIVRSVIGLAHQCNLTVVAEGVEDGATLFALLNMDCDLAQGYLIARPMEADAATQWIEKHHANPQTFSFLTAQDRERLARTTPADECR